MPKSYQFSQEQIMELKAAKKANKNKTIDKRLEALLLRAAKVKREEVSKKTGFCKQYITDLTAKYQKDGLTAIVDNHYAGNRRNMSFEEEAALLAEFEEQAEKGQLVEISAIAAAYEKKVGHSIGGSQIYYVLARHGYRKVMPRSKHPKSATPEAIEASKKLTHEWKKQEQRFLAKQYV
jgi:transposase